MVLVIPRRDRALGMRASVIMVVIDIDKNKRHTRNEVEPRTLFLTLSHYITPRTQPRLSLPGQKKE